MLGHAGGGVARHIGHADAPALRVIQIHVVDAGGGDADQLQVFCLSQGSLIQHQLVGQDHIRLPDPLRALFPGGLPVDHQLPVLGEAAEIQILPQTGGLQHNNFHSFFPFHDVKDTAPAEPEGGVSDSAFTVSS